MHADMMMSVQVASLLVLATATFISESSASVLLPESLPELSSDRFTTQPKFQSREVLSAEPDTPAVSLEGAKFIPFKWGVEEITTPEKDSFKYEKEISALLDSPLSDWAVLPEARFRVRSKNSICTAFFGLNMLKIAGFGRCRQNRKERNLHAA